MQHYAAVMENHMKKGLKTLTFIATPLTRGQQFLLALYLWYALPAFNIGLSTLPPPATIPITALLNDGTDFLIPEGSLILVTFVSWLWDTTVA